MSLKEDLRAVTAAFQAGLSQETASAMALGATELEATRMTDRAVKAGDSAPAFWLPDAYGSVFTLSQLLSRGPLIISFVRGDWCPYCSLEVRALAASWPEIVEAGGSVVVISAQLPATGRFADGRDLPFPILFDDGARVATAYGLAFKLPAVLRPLYEQFGHALPEKNGTGWILPVPATYLVGRDGRIALSFIDTDYRQRLEPSEIVGAVACLARHPARHAPVAAIHPHIPR